MLKNDQQLTKNLNRKPVNITRQCQKNSRCNKNWWKIPSFYGLISKTAEELENHKSANIKRKINDMNRAMDIEKVNKFYLSWILATEQKFGSLNQDIRIFFFDFEVFKW